MITIDQFGDRTIDSLFGTIDSFTTVQIGKPDIYIYINQLLPENVTTITLTMTVSIQ